MIAVIRIRGTVNNAPAIKATLENLSLYKPNHMVLLREEASLKGMVDKAKDYITYGKISGETLALVLEKRARLEGDKRLGEEFLKEKGFKGFGEMADVILGGKTTLRALGVKPVFRLHPPRKGHKRAGIKKPFLLGGALGNRGEKINELIVKMS